jgi:hypothetical protein
MDFGEPAQQLVVVLDVNPAAWDRFALEVLSGGVGGGDAAAAATEPRYSTSAGAAVITSVFEQVIAFINSFLLLNRANQVAVIAAHPSENVFLYPPSLSSTSTLAVSTVLSGSKPKRKRDKDKDKEGKDASTAIAPTSSSSSSSTGDAAATSALQMDLDAADISTSSSSSYSSSSSEPIVIDGAGESGGGSSSSSSKQPSSKKEEKQSQRRRALQESGEDRSIRFVSSYIATELRALARHTAGAPSSGESLTQQQQQQQSEAGERKASAAVDAAEGDDETVLMAGALSLALCHINRMQVGPAFFFVFVFVFVFLFFYSLWLFLCPPLFFSLFFLFFFVCVSRFPTLFQNASRPVPGAPATIASRVLVVQASADLDAHAQALMNCIFAAEVSSSAGQQM